MRKRILVIVAFILGAILFSGATGVVAYGFGANQVGFAPNDNAWKVNSVDDAINDLYIKKTADNYSLEEKEVGTWIDGKPLYQKTFIYTTATSGSKDVKVGTIQNMDTAFIVDGYYINQNANFGGVGASYMLTNTGRNTDTTAYTSYFYVNTRGEIIGLFGNYTASSKIVVTVRYTKTTDTVPTENNQG